MSSKIQKPLPRVDELHRPFWEAARRHELVLQRCRKCASYRYPAGPTCPECVSDELEWTRVSGRGTVFTWTVFHRAYHPAFADEVPYAVVAVELVEGPRMLTNLLDCLPADIKIGMPVEVVFEDVTEEIRLPKFRPVSR
ncbi:MAG: Zn-ribbon domain-containing OB-fold protein [Dehalococcoidia bacterium]|nr:Zn-ribbon domain-containing OB-fold protein [Dehalococcoidia bacterium]